MVNLIISEILTQLPAWLLGNNSQSFLHLTQQFLQQFTHLKERNPAPKILLAEPEVGQFLASFTAACAAGCDIFLGNPDWGQQEWQQVFELVNPDYILGKKAQALWKKIKPINLQPVINSHGSNLIMIPTGGSSGKIRFVIHSWETLTASVQGFQQYFQVAQVNSFCVLPLYHVSGLMQFMRSFVTGGKLAVSTVKAVEAGEFYNIHPEEFFISLVPTQLQRLLQNAETTHWLSRFQTVLLGGAPAWPELLETARKQRIRLAPTYGMTETASQIATLKPDDFLAGDYSCGQVLPHTRITIRDQNGQILAGNQTGIITIQAASLALGYYPELFPQRDSFQVDDLGYLDENHNLYLVGRSSDKIITGGENVFPAEVEAAILATHLVTDICILGIPDPHWGQAVTALYVPKDATISIEMLKNALTDQLSNYKQPKHWIQVENLPRNAQGKINRQSLQTLL